jgi:hypothetical protein|tara:strand:+ start:274 stop:567 length:294 start_codon:yes stop_codon:yes gene_type:complete
MRKFLLGVLLLPTLALAEPVTVEKKVVCDKASIMLPYVKEKYNEEPLWLGVDGESNYALTVNQETQTWSMFQYSAEGDISCLIDSGTGFKFKIPNML